MHHRYKYKHKSGYIDINDLSLRINRNFISGRETEVDKQGEKSDGKRKGDR